MKWFLPNYYLKVYFIIYVVQNVATSRINDFKLEVYKKCMKSLGIPSWKVVDRNTNSTHYNIYSYQWNKIFPTVLPVAIFVPLSTTDVQASVKCGFKSDIQLVPNSGGHSYAGLSQGTNDSIVVDFRLMTSIHMNENEESVTVGPGAFVGHVVSKLWKNGGWGTLLGMCMTVGIGGHAIGGGVSYFSSLYGLVIDNILEMEVVDGRGNVVTVNENRNTDLWWALRGVGPGYIGMVTNIKLKMFKAKDLKLTLTQIRWQIKDFQNLIGNYSEWLDWARQNEPHVMSIIYVFNDNYYNAHQPALPGITLHLLHIQDPKLQPNSSENFLQAFPKFFPNAIETLTKKPSFIELVIGTSYTPVVAAQPQLNSSTSVQSTTNPIEQKLNFFSTLTKEMAIPRYYFSKSFFVKKHFRSEQLNGVQAVLNEIPNYTSGIQINSEQGAVSSRRPTDSSYVHRNSLFNVRVFHESLDGSTVVAGRNWTNKFMQAAKLMDSGETYQNYPDLELVDYLRRYYGGNLKKLIQIKRKWDPYGYFNSKMSIPTKLSDLIAYWL